MIVLLDSGPLGLLTHPSSREPYASARAWARAVLGRGDQLRVPEISDYEVRRELLRARKRPGVARLDELASGVGYLPLTTLAMRQAAALWARARRTGRPTAHEAALDGDVLLAAQAIILGADVGVAVTVATTNTKHLARYVDARMWSDI